MENPLIDLKGLSKPLTKLIEVVAQGTGTLYAPYGTVRQARADAKAMVILAEAEHEVMNLEARAQKRLEHRESIRQENIEAITVKAAGELSCEVSNDPVSPDWVLHFFDCSQDVCDSEMQSLWARILAGEVAQPDSYARRTVDFLKTLDKFEAQKFSELCAFAIQIGNDWHCLIESEGIRKEIYEALGPSLYIDHFVSIGLLAPEPSMPASSSLSGAKLKYFEKTFILEGPPPTAKGNLPTLDCVIFRNFTQIGHQLAKISGAKPLEGFTERLANYLKSESNITLKDTETGN